MNKTIFTLSLIILAALSLTSCKEKPGESPSPNSSAKEYTQSKPTVFKGEWIYFSFATGKEVEGVTESNYQESLNWDIAFNSFFFRTNSGKSGKGKGGALKTEQQNLADVKEAPTTGYDIDKEYVALGYNGQVLEHNTTANVVLSGISKIQLQPRVDIQLGEAIKFQGPPPTYRPNDKVFIIRTAEGKYAKVKFISYSNAEGRPGYISFKYVYQANGSTKFD
ncbi:MAG: HmuY family protein [Porphyromonas sp.]|nr:HmuY family protein [Porphyromonas sp.]